MKQISRICTFLLFLHLVAISITAESIQQFLRDEANLLTKEQAAKIEKVLSDHNAAGPGKIRVLIITNLPPNTTIEKFAFEQINKPGVKPGEKLDRVLLAIAVKDRVLRIETSKAVGGYLPDSTCKKIIDTSIVPQFKQAEYLEGVEAGVREMILRLKLLETNKLKQD